MSPICDLKKFSGDKQKATGNPGGGSGRGSFKVEEEEGHVYFGDLFISEHFLKKFQAKIHPSVFKVLAGTKNVK